MENRIATTIEQSKKLLELGIDVYTADMFWKNGVSDKYIQCFTPFVSSGTDIDYDYDIPAWSFPALLGLMPFHMIENNVRYKFQMVKGLNKEGETYMIKYKGYTSLVETIMYNNPIDAAFEMVCWLKENNKI